MRGKKLALLLPIILVTSLIIIIMMALNNKNSVKHINIEQKNFPPFILQTLEKQQQIIDEHIFSQQQLTLLNVWASWCVVCKEEHPFLIELAQQGVPIVGLNYRDDRQSAILLLRKMGNPYQDVIFDSKGQLALDLGVIGTPESYLVTRSGQVISRFNGVLDKNIWAQLFAPHFTALNTIKER